MKAGDQTILALPKRVNSHSNRGAVYFIVPWDGKECYYDPLSPIDQVGWLKAGDQTILALHKRVITHNNRIAVTHEDNKVSFGFKTLMN